MTRIEKLTYLWGPRAQTKLKAYRIRKIRMLFVSIHFTHP